jgi:hypothetical protein
MRGWAVIGLGLALLAGATGTAAAQATGLGSYGSPAPPPNPPPTISPADRFAAPPPATPGSATVRLQGRMVVGGGAVSDSGRGH